MWIPLDPAPADDGNLALTSTGNVRVLPKEERERYPGPLFKSHYATCPHAEEHRQKSRKGVDFARERAKAGP